MKRKIKQIEKELEVAEKEYSNAFNEYFNINLHLKFSEKELEEYFKPFNDKISSLSRELRMIKHPKYQGIPDYGDLMTIEKFLEYVRDGDFIDYDGHGNYSKPNVMSDIRVYPSDVKYNMIRKDFTHVIWFNR